MPTYVTYMIYTAALLTVLVVLVPKAEIKRLMVYAIIVGGVADVLLLLLVGHLMNAGGYINYGPFGFVGIPFFPPLAWSIWFIMFIYFLPDSRLLRYIYVATAASYSTLFANVLIHLEIFEWRYNRLWLAFLIYLAWFSTALLAQKKLEMVAER